MDLVIEIERSEILDAAVVLNFVGSDMTDSSGFVALHGNGVSRVWAATDGFSATKVTGELDSREYRVLLSPAQFSFLIAAARTDENPRVQVRDDGTTSVSTRHAELRSETRHPHHFLFDYDFDSIKIGASGEFSLSEMTAHIDSLLLNFDSGSEMRPVSRMALAEGHLRFGCSVDGVGEVESRLAGRGVAGDILLSVDLLRLRNMLSVFGPGTDVAILLPNYLGNPVIVKSANRIASLMPWQTPIEVARTHAEATIEEVFGHLAVQRDRDGDYRLRRHGNLIFGRLSDDANPIAFQVFGVLLRDVEPTPELFSEMNAINSKLPFAKLILVEDVVIVEAALVAASMDAVELETAVSKISRALEDYAATLSIMFGGSKEGDPMAARWSAYRSTIIHAEISPGRIEHLNGPEAVIPWPFPQPVHVVSGWNPQGVALDGEYVNSQIAADTLRRGGRFVLCSGVSRDGSYSEPSLAIWGLSRDDAREIGRKASQDAIFEIVNEEVRLVACITDEVESFPRRECGSADHEIGYL